MSMLNSQSVQYIEIEKLLLDGANPRFGAARGARSNQVDILDYIVENFGIDDVLSSLAHNGYFEAEPLIAKKNDDGTYTIVEGNRRLSACLILSQDVRAKNQLQRLAQFSDDIKSQWNGNTQIPVHIFSTTDNLHKLNAYLGVRHITSAKAWDSYAKAAWIDSIIKNRQMTLEQICEVTGDRNRTIKRLLEGYYFINQLIDSGHFNPKNSSRKGRGSNPDFPFSWVYTLLNYEEVREYLALNEFNPADERPIPSNKIKEASSVVRYMFGDRSSSTNAAIKDSRQLGALASAVGNPVQRDHLERGRSLQEVEKITKPAIDQITASLAIIRDELADATAVVNGGRLTDKEIESASSQAREIASMAKALYLAVRNIGDAGFLE